MKLYHVARNIFNTNRRALGLVCIFLPSIQFYRINSSFLNIIFFFLKIKKAIFFFFFFFFLLRILILLFYYNKFKKLNLKLILFLIIFEFKKIKINQLFNFVNLKNLYPAILFYFSFIILLN